MNSPELYTIYKIELVDLIDFKKIDIKRKNKKGELVKGSKTVHELKKSLLINENKSSEYIIKQQNNHLFRIIKNNKAVLNNHIEDVVFIDCKNNKEYQKELDSILRNGITINDKQFKYWGKSASMSRNGILGFVSADMYDIVEKYAMMEIQFDKTILSKFEAYKCLLLSSCFCIEKELPYMIVVDDYESVVKDVNIKYVDEKEIEYIDQKTNTTKIFKEKIIKEGRKDINNNIVDGAGLCSVEQANKWKEYLELQYTPCAFMLRVPYVKGISIVADFKKYYKEKGVTKIKDIWGNYHNVEDIDIILTKSQYKGYKYFQKTKTYSDWEMYISLLKKYNYCIGISKWNYSHKKEPKMTRGNYQTLQTLDISTDELIEMSAYTRRWIERILGGDLLYVYKYLGISEKTEPLNNYMKAIILNPQMINDIKVKSYLYNLLKKTIDEIKIGKIHLNGAFKIIIPDIVLMMEYIGGLEPIGCLKAGEMYAKEHLGNYVLNRNPHISKSEHVILNAVNNDIIKKWCPHLENVVMVNAYDITAQRLNGADYDGDLAMVHNNKIFMKGIDNNLPITIDVDDKITAQEVEYNVENIISFTKKSLDSRIGEISNCASSYSNKLAKDEKTKKKYEDNTCLLSVINGKEIDYVKTGIRWNVPSQISRNSKPLPYFLKYKYPKLKKLNMSKTKMNEHCWFIEKWERGLKFNNDFINTSYCIIDNSIPFNEIKYNEVSDTFKIFKKEYKRLKDEEKMAKNYDKYKDYFEGYSKFEVENTKCDWDGFYDKYKNIFEEIVPNKAELANYLVELVYNKQNGSCYNLLWEVANEGILINLNTNRIKPILVPVESEDKTGTEYLGRYYKLVDYKGEI